MWAWGDGSWGQLGNGSTGTSTTPSQVCAIGEVLPCARFLTGVVDIAAGYVHSTALLADGTVVTWGDSRYGELGNGYQESSAVPVEVCDEGAAPPCASALSNVLTGIERLAAGGDGHTLALKSGQLWAWGANKNGQVGEGVIVRGQTTPAHVCDVGEVAPCTSFLHDVVEMDAWSSHSLAVTSTGGVWSWGSNDYGQLGSAAPSVEGCQNPPCQDAPGPVCLSADFPCTTPLVDVTMIAAARRFSLAVKDGEVWSWGYDPDGELGHGAFGSEPLPGRVCAGGEISPCASYLSRVVGVATGNFHSLALDATGALWSWGYNGSGQLGDGTLESRAAPVRVLGY